MLFYSFFKTLIGKPITIHLKNDLEISGTLLSVDPFLNLKIEEIALKEASEHPHLLALKTVFVRGSVVRYVEMAREAVDTGLLEDASRVEFLNPHVGTGPNATAGGKKERDGDDEEASDE